MASASIMFLFSFLLLADIDDENCLTDHNDVTTGLFKGLILLKKILLPIFSYNIMCVKPVDELPRIGPHSLSKIVGHRSINVPMYILQRTP